MTDGLLRTLAEFFDRLLTSSWQAAIVVLGILAVQWVFRKQLSAGVRHGLWLVLLAKLALPLLPESGMSIFNVVPRSPAQWEIIGEVAGPEVSPGSGETSVVDPGVPSLSNLPRENVHDTYFVFGVTIPPVHSGPSWPKRIVMVIWSVVLILLVCRAVVHNLRFRRRVSRAQAVDREGMEGLIQEVAETLRLPQAPPVVESPAVQTPAVYGVWQPRVILPVGLADEVSEQQLRFVLLHEMAHIRRRDLFFVWVGHLVQMVHWFNPVLWFAFERMRADCERATDAHVLRALGEPDHSSYGETILLLVSRVSRRYRVPGLIGILEEKKQLAERMVAIRDFTLRRKRSLFAYLGVAALVATVLTRATTDPGDNGDSTSLRESAEPLSATEPGVNLPTGTVLGSDGSPVEGAAIYRGRRSWLFQKSSTTNERGQFKIQAQTPDWPDLVIVAPGHAPLLDIPHADVVGQDRSFQLRPPAVISGRVVDAEGKPVEGGTVIPGSWYQFRDFDTRIKTDADGRFAWREAPDEGEVRFTIFAKGFLNIRDYALVAGDEATIRLTPQEEFVGTVVDAATGAPIDAFEYVLGEKQREEGRIMNVHQNGSGKEGNFSLSIREPARPFHVVTVKALGYAIATSPLFRDGEGPHAHRFELQKSGPLVIPVQLPSGAAASRARAYQVLRDDHGMMVRSPRTVDERRLRDEKRITQTGDDGQLQIEPVADVVGLFLTHPEGYAELDWNEVESSEDVVLRPWGTLQGTLFRGESPLSEADMSIFRASFRSPDVILRTKTGADGSFLISGIPAGDYRISVGQGTTIAAISVTDGESTEIMLAKGSRRVMGRAVLQGESTVPISWQRDDHYLVTELLPPSELRAPSQEEVAADPNVLVEYNQRSLAYWSSPEGRRRRLHERRYRLQMEADGSFVVEGVIPDDYLLSLSIQYREQTGPNSYETKLIASTRHQLNVPASRSGDYADAFDVGDVAVPVVKNQRR